MDTASHLVRVSIEIHEIDFVRRKPHEGDDLLGFAYADDHDLAAERHALGETNV